MTPAGMPLSSLIMMISCARLSLSRASPVDANSQPGCEDHPAGVSNSARRRWAEPEIEEIRRRQDAAQAMGGPQKVARQRASGRLTMRERIDRLADSGTFAEIGALTGFGDYDAEGRLVSVLPANFVAGTARIDGRPVMIGADDFTVRGGSGDAAIHAKQVFAEEYANQMLLPVVRLLDGASGGGSVTMAQDAGYTYVPAAPPSAPAPSHPPPHLRHPP